MLVRIPYFCKITKSNWANYLFSFFALRHLSRGGLNYVVIADEGQTLAVDVRTSIFDRHAKARLVHFLWRQDHFGMFYLVVSTNFHDVLYLKLKFKFLSIESKCWRRCTAKLRPTTRQRPSAKAAKATSAYACHLTKERKNYSTKLTLQRQNRGSVRNDTWRSR